MGIKPSLWSLERKKQVMCHLSKTSLETLHQSRVAIDYLITFRTLHVPISPKIQ